MKKVPFLLQLTCHRAVLSVSLTLLSGLCHGQELLFGLTQKGGYYDKGVPYQITTEGADFISYTDLDGNNGERPGNGAAFTQLIPNGLINKIMVALTESGDQNLGIGNRLQIIPGKGGLVPPFRFHFSSSTTGINPGGRFLTAVDGALYGLTSAGGRDGGGALFTMPAVFGSGASALLSFNGPERGRSPKGSLIQGPDGRLYGMTEFGGANDKGVIFSYDRTARDFVFRKLLDFDDINSGSHPTGNLLFASDGKLYGMTRAGGMHGDGVIFSISLDGTGFKKLLNFDRTLTGAAPRGSLTEFTDGRLYGMTSEGGVNGYGAIFSITPQGEFSKIHDFDGTGGKNPVGDLLVSTTGAHMYGVTYGGGVDDKGVLFRIANGRYEKVYDYKESTGSNPVGTLAMLREAVQFIYPAIPEKTTLSEPFTLIVSSNADLPIYLTSSDHSVAVVENNKIRITGAGAATITAFQLGNHKYLPGSATQMIVVKKIEQTITFEAIPRKTYGDKPFSVTATSSSGLPVTFSMFSNDVATHRGNTVTVLNAGTVGIRANQAGDAIYSPAAEVIQHLIVDRADQTIDFSTDPVRLCCEHFTLTATASSGLDVSFKTPDRDKLDIYESIARIRELGTAEIIAYHRGSRNYNPAEAKGSVELHRGTQAIYFNLSKSSFTFGDAPVYVSGFSSARLPLTFTSDPPGVAVIEGSQLHILGIGTTTITATQNGSSLVSPAAPVARTVTVLPPISLPDDNIITWSDLPAKTTLNPPFNLTAKASSGLPVSYTSSNTSVATISGNLVTIHAAGTTTLTAIQGGKDTIAAASPVQKVLQIMKADQYINVPYSTSVYFGDPPLDLALTSSAGLPIIWTSSNNSIASVENYQLHFHDAGIITLTALQAGDDKHEAATTERQVRIYPLNQSIAFEPLTPRTYGDNPFMLTATASSGNDVRFSTSDPAIASIDGRLVTIGGAGTVTIAARQDSPGYYSAEVSRQLIINKKKQSIVVTPVADKKFGDLPFAVSGTSDSGLPVVFTSATPAVAKVSGDMVTITGNGMAKIVASQPGNNNYAPAENAIIEFPATDVGNVYNMIGATWSGGPNTSGVIFSIDSEGDGYTLLKQFAPRTLPKPQSGFIKGFDGRMYGNFHWGGKNNLGQIVRLNADGTAFTILYDYETATGSSPFGNLIQADDGYLYGMTRLGGNNSGGTIFRINTDGTDFSAIHHFSSFGGTSPLGGLMEASDGNLYGMTANGGFFGFGTIFRINKDGGKYTVLMHLNDSGILRTGNAPRGDLTQGPDGFLYGTLLQGGVNNQGTLFKIATDGSAFMKLLDFNGGVTGAAPGATLLQGSDGKIYGMTQAGGANNAGTVFSMNTDGTGYFRLLDFDVIDSGANPAGKLTEATDGMLYGLTNAGGVNAKGAAFRISKDGTIFEKLIDFDSTASTPVFGPLLESTPGNFFGMTSRGGANDGGAVFHITRENALRIIKDFPQEESGPRLLIQDPTGAFLYGIASNGSSTNSGSVFRIDDSGTNYAKVMDLPAGFVTYGMFYVSTDHLWFSGTMDGASFMFRIRPDGSEYQPILEFNHAGVALSRCLVEAIDGYVYGTTAGGRYAAGIVFRLKKDGTGYAKVLDMPVGIETGPGQFIQASDGNFYVATAYKSNLYRFTAEGSITEIFKFPTEAGGLPIKLIETNGGSIAIVTRNDGKNNLGALFTVEKDGSSFSLIHSQDYETGSSPVDLLQTMDGWFYVATQMGGAHGKGVIYKVRGDGSSFEKLRDFSGDDGDMPSALVFLKEAQSITFNPIAEKKINDEPFFPEAFSTSGARVKLSSSNPEVAIIEDGKIKPVGAGNSVITASVPASANFFEARQAHQSLEVTKEDQTIDFEELVPIYVGDGLLKLNAISSSGLPVTYESSDPRVASIDGNVVVPHALGNTVITASQAGDEKYNAAESVARGLEVVNGGPQTITFTNPDTRVLGEDPLLLTATASSALPVTFSTTSDKVSLTGAEATVLKAGYISISADQPGDTYYDPAPTVEVSFCISPRRPVISVSGSEQEYLLHSSNDGGNQWYLDGAMLAGASGNSIPLIENGSYQVTTTVENCSSQMSLPYEHVTTGLANDPELSIEIFPNPIGDALAVELNGEFSPPATLELIDGMGRILESRKLMGPGIESFAFGTAPAGVYFVKIMYNKKVYVRKLLK